MRGGDSLPRPAAAPPITPRPIPGSSRDPRAVVGAYLGLTAEVLRTPVTEMQWVCHGVRLLSPTANCPPGSSPPRRPPGRPAAPFQGVAAIQLPTTLQGP